VGMFFTKKVFQKHGVHNEDYTNASDYEYAIRLFSRGLRPKWIPHKLVRYYFHGDNLGESPEAKATAERIKREYAKKLFNF
jgi:hypothetical protein